MGFQIVLEALGVSVTRNRIFAGRMRGSTMGQCLKCREMTKLDNRFVKSPLHCIIQQYTV